MLRSLKTNLKQAQQLIEHQVNKHRRDVQLKVGHKVLVHLQPYRQTTAAQRQPQKLARSYYGPFSIIEKIVPVAYKIEFPPGCKIHAVFHVSSLKPFYGGEQPSTTPLPPLSKDNKLVSMPIAICTARIALG